MRQVRVKPNSCSIPHEFKETITTCYNEHDTRSGVQDKSPYGPNNTYVWSENTDDETPIGELGEIPRGGYIEIFSAKNSSGLDLSASLQVQLQPCITLISSPIILVDFILIYRRLEVGWTATHVLSLSTSTSTTSI
jgi:hypothetical protein